MNMRVAIRPMFTKSNSFVGRFSNAVAVAGHDVTAMVISMAPMLRNDVCLLHWPNEFFVQHGRRRTFTKLVKIRLARMLGMKLVWVAHNRAPHSGEAASATIIRAFFASLDGIIYLSEASKSIIRADYPVHRRTIECVTVHGMYPPDGHAVEFTPPGATEIVRLASYGLIRAYKNFVQLAALTASLDGVMLDVFGRRFDPAVASALEQIEAQAPNVRIDLRDAPFSDPELERRIDAAHGVVLPYREILNSGAALHALSRNRPVLAPALGSLPELQRTVGSKWVHLYDGALNAERIADFCAAIRSLKEERPNLEAYEWPRVVRDLREFFAKLERA